MSNEEEKVIGLFKLNYGAAFAVKVTKSFDQEIN